MDGGCCVRGGFETLRSLVSHESKGTVHVPTGISTASSLLALDEFPPNCIPVNLVAVGNYNEQMLIVGQHLVPPRME